MVRWRPRSGPCRTALSGLIVFSAGCRSGSPPARPLDAMRRAHRVLETGLEAIGPKAVRDSVRTVVRHQRLRRITEAQGTNPKSPGAIPGSRVSILDLGGDRYSESRYLQIPGGQPWGIRTVITPTSASFLELSNGTYRPYIVSTDIGRAPLFRRSAETLLLAAAARPFGMRWVGHSERKARRADAISFPDADGVLITLYFDPETHLLEGAEFLGDDPVLGDYALSVEFADYRQVGGLLVPFKSTERGPGVDRWETEVTSVEVNAPVPDSVFELPAGMTPAAEPSLGGMKPRELADGVFAMPAPSASLAVIFPEYVLVVEAPASSRRSEMVIGWLNEVAPGKPIRYVVATHFHHDHIGGIRPYVALGATILTTPDAKESNEAVASSTHTVPDRLSALSVAPRIEVVERERVIGDGDRRVILRQIGPNAHVDQMLLAYVPGGQIVFESDLLSTIWGQPVPGGEAAADLARVLEELAWPVKWIVAGHGVPVAAETLRQALSAVPAEELCAQPPLRAWGACKRRPAR